MQKPPSANGLIFNNADSFALAFDQAWQAHNRRDPGHPEETDAVLDKVLALVADHPFAQANPTMARQVGAFRIRLLATSLRP